MYTSIIPIFAAFLTAFVLYRPFITRLDRVKYYVFSTIAFFTPWILSVSSLADEKYYTANNTVTADYRLHWSSHYRPVQSTMNHQQQQSYSQSYLFIDATVLALGAAMAVSILGLLTRWHFAILFVNPRANSFTSILIRHGISMALVLFGIVR
ncbi:uncharacterized protein BYT42DRAFT_524846 [Radiomyces spectabilis]|uniref:uncharacterized protein n=1 Tax=Radiomyces spectabilis TaxID=64574 RepID=UPI00221E811C|nr:uncharacterized protein BYT42DRAFT_524846 [Radiomyces spectabilis]KAI8393658.1 hypothetical protein BYT42DRAFT_524846 [Radiomyces spectabilis]